MKDRYLIMHKGIARWKLNNSFKADTSEFEICTVMKCIFWVLFGELGQENLLWIMLAPEGCTQALIIN